jgi:glycosyltransferase involved in cell wall biosynthesis
MSSRVPARIVSCSRDAVRAHKELGYAVRNIQMIPNGFDTDLFHPDEQARRSVRDELGLAADALLVGNFGRFTILKDHRTLMRAAAVMLPEDPKLHLVLCGARVDPANAELARWTAETGHGDRILLLGERRDMSRLAAALDVYCSSSSMEAFPLVVGEAMASGVPCVVTDVGDSALLVGGTGRVVPPGDPAALAAAMVSLLAMAPGDRQKLGMTGRVRIIENFGLQGTVDAYLSLYRELLGPA